MNYRMVTDGSMFVCGHDSRTGMPVDRRDAVDRFGEVAVANAEIRLEMGRLFVAWIDRD